VRRIVAEAKRWLAPGGRLLVETSRSQTPASVAAFERQGLAARIVTSDELDATVVIGWPERPGSPNNQSGAGH
jgi:release factor glutamine methyltransferase